MAENKNIQQYTGEQIVLSSGRLVFNSRSDSTFINSRQYINLSAGEKITIDIGTEDSDNEENMFLVNAPKIQFGLERFGKAEQIVKADELKTILIELMQKIIEFHSLNASAAVLSPTPIYGLAYQANAQKLSGDLLAIQAKLDNFKSKITYTI